MFLGEEFTPYVEVGAQGGTCCHYHHHCHQPWKGFSTLNCDHCSRMFWPASGNPQPMTADPVLPSSPCCNSAYQNVWPC